MIALMLAAALAAPLAAATAAPPAAATGAAAASAPPVALPPLPPPPPEASGTSGAIDVEAATRAYLDLLPAQRRAQSNAYFEGGYWLHLWDFLWTAAIYLLLLQTGASARMREWAERLTRFAALQTAIYWLQFLAATAVLSFPLTVYRHYFREHRYQLSNLSFGGWLAEEAKGLLVAAIFGALGLVALYAVVRKLRRSWWIWGAVVSLVFIAFGALIAPVFIVPLFNNPKRLADERVVAPILSMARANGIPAQEVWEIDASKQSKRISANVSGLFGTQRITLNDNLLARCSLPEIEAVMGHEMGHHVLNHVYKGLLEFGVIIAAGFALLNALFGRLRVRPRWGVRDISDPAGLPLAALIVSAFFFLATPVTNSIVRTAEQEADIFGINAARQPDGFAQVALKLSEYRKLEPGPVEELIFFDHPSGRTRIRTAMRWKAEHPETWSAAKTSAAPR
jgi:STE24 endopeptidase